MSDDVLPLFRHAPVLRDRVPHLSLGTFPTPVDRMRIEMSGGSREILVKRDDACGAGYAGNKLRKLEFILAEAQSVGARRLVTAGATGSHHAFATAYHGRRHGFDVSLVLFPQTLTDHVRDMLLLDLAVGAELRWASRMETVPYGMWRAQFVHRGEQTYVVPPGGSSETGTLAYVSAGLELAEQIERGDVARPTSVHVATGTLGTAVGLAIGMTWAGLEIPLIATRITTRLLTNERSFALVTRRTLARLRALGATPPDADAVLARVVMRHDQIGAGYGRATEAGDVATETFARAGLVLDATYTAKAAASVVGDVGDLPLFWHTLSAVAPYDHLDGISSDALPEPFRSYATSSAARPARGG